MPLFDWMRDRSSDVSNEEYERASDLILDAGHTAVLTGAGISTGSGIPDFRSPESGLWEQTNAMEVASIRGFEEEPERFYQWIRPLAQKMQKAEPNSAHEALASLQTAGLVDTIVTQNIDDLHQQAGAEDVVHVHGSAAGAVCLNCGHAEDGREFWAAYLNNGSETVPHCPQCGAVLKPDVILFGEELPHEALKKAQQAALNCDLMLVVGTSLEVMPVADLPRLALRGGARMIILNLTGTALDHRASMVVTEDVTVSLPRIASLCLKE